jgi:hypothetical protein
MAAVMGPTASTAGETENHPVVRREPYDLFSRRLFKLGLVVE